MPRRDNVAEVTRLAGSERAATAALIAALANWTRAACTSQKAITAIQAGV